jgi:hypothetical protein
MLRIRRSLFIGAAFVLIVSQAQAQAGFFDQLFGGRPESQPYYGYPAPFGQWDGAPIRQRSHRARAVAVEEKPVKQTPTDLMHDPTLRYGDAVMMASGVDIFTGERGSSHDRDDFTPLQDAKHMRPRDKMALAAVVDGTMAPGAPVSGRSASVTIPIAKGVMIHDPSGRAIRYVGP